MDGSTIRHTFRLLMTAIDPSGEQYVALIKPA
jgi:hypothetical protein